MSDDRSLTFLAKEDDSGKAIALLTAVVVLGLTFHAYSFFVIKNDEILNKYTEPVFSVTYQESNLQGSDSMLIADGETDSFQLSRETIGADASLMMAKISISVSYEETSGQIADPCDEVLAQIPPNGMVADWQHPDNVLSDSNDDCETMNLVVFVYPGYSSEAKQEVGESAEHWERMWTNSSYGSGVLELQVSVETNTAPGSVLPGNDDTNEEINVQWTVELFEVEVEPAPMM
ncbi:MAG: hypothetical protein VYB23_00450 [Candidatus Thermoplasmatota archaeon]|nr:hypothetical protein [Candidatus Thermoplasmatota archaeon]